MGRIARGHEWFIRRIVEGDPLLNSESIERLSAQLGIMLRDCGYFCVVARYAADGEMTQSIDYPQSLYEACMSVGRKLHNDFSCYIGTGFCVVMLLSDDGEERPRIVGKLHQQLYRHTARQIQLGVGRSYCDLIKLSYSQAEAYEALSSMEPGEQISYIDDIYATRNITTSKLESEKRRVVELFKSGELEQMEENMTLLAENVRKESPVREGMPYPTSIRRTIVELLVEIMHISADAGVDVDKLINYQNPYNRVFEVGGTPEILAWFMDVTRLLYRNISELSSKTESNMLTVARRCIEEHLSDPELSLSLVSEELGITPTYFSAFFIREVGTGFNEYITGLRIERAKQLLDGSTMKINRIASECGFRSASYFIVVFRKQTGMSPGEYRNRKK